MRVQKRLQFAFQFDGVLQVFPIQGRTEGRTVSLPVVGNYAATKFLYIFKVPLVYEMVWILHSTTILEYRKLCSFDCMPTLPS